MANALTPLMPTVLARGLKVLRENCVMPRLVNTDFANVPQGQGDTVNVWLSSALTPSAVAPSATPVTPQDSSPVKVPITLDQWRKNGFYMTDKEVGDLGEGLKVKQLDEAVKGLANEINAYLLGKYKKVYGIVGTPGTTPFASDTTAATQARKILNKQLAPLQDRRIVLDPDSEANAVELAKLTTWQNVGDAKGITDGTIGRKLGFDWFMDQQIPTHTPNAIGAGALTVNGAQAVGAGSTDGGRSGTISIAKGAGANWSAIKGDIITIAGDSQTYVVTADTTVTQAANTTVPISPALKKATAGGEAVAFKAAHVVNMAFHPDAFAFASRPLQSSAANSENVLSIADPVSGVVLRLELIRQNKQDYMEFDVLYGAECVRPELAVRIAG